MKLNPARLKADRNETCHRLSVSVSMDFSGNSTSTGTPPTQQLLKRQAVLLSAPYAEQVLISTWHRPEFKRRVHSRSMLRASTAIASMTPLSSAPRSGCTSFIYAATASLRNSRDMYPLATTKSSMVSPRPSSTER